ncbi:hypothetical protein FB451DRAFT_1555664 [Mycena latifolia]|nr:hypothetical protein FB451DRAFT_1555664 [Mycena latifolia]
MTGASHPTVSSAYRARCPPRCIARVAHRGVSHTMPSAAYRARHVSWPARRRPRPVHVGEERRARMLGTEEVQGRRKGDGRQCASLPFFSSLSLSLLVLPLLSFSSPSAFFPRLSLPPATQEMPTETHTPLTEFTTDIAALPPATRVKLLHSRARLLPRFDGRLHEMVRVSLDVFSLPSSSCAARLLDSRLRLPRRRAAVHRHVLGCTARAIVSAGASPVHARTMRHFMPARRGARLARRSLARDLRFCFTLRACTDPVSHGATVRTHALHSGTVPRSIDIELPACCTRLEAQGRRGVPREADVTAPTSLRFAWLCDRAPSAALDAHPRASTHHLRRSAMEGASAGASMAAVETCPLPETRDVLPGPLGCVVRDGRVHLGSCTAARTRKYQVVPNIFIVFFGASILEITFSSLGINASRFAQEDHQ